MLGTIKSRHSKDTTPLETWHRTQRQNTTPTHNTKNMSNPDYTNTIGVNPGVKGKQFMFLIRHPCYPVNKC
jgi:hypothetical protein